jgi:hypothetical protein
LGNLLNNNLKGRPNENQLIGSALDLGKKKLNNLLLGSPSQAAVNFAKAGGVLYDSISAYGKVMNAAQYLPEDMIDMRKDLSSKYNSYVEPTVPKLPLTNHIAIPNVIKTPKTKFSRNEIQRNNSIERVRAMFTTSDYLNKQVSYPSATGLKNDLIKDTEKQLGDYDFVTLKFWSVVKKAAVNFRATISGLSETLTPSWDTNKFIGNPFNFYTYNGIERSLTFSFKVYSLSYDEHIAAWQRLNFLTSLTYPQGYSQNAVYPPFIRFTLGDMFRNKEAYIDSLTYTIDDNSPWEIGIDTETKDWKLPKIVNVDITLKLVETIGSTYQKRLYGYGDVPANVSIKQDGNKELNADGSPKKKEDGTQNDVKKESTAQNPSEEKPKPPKNPNGIFVEKYKDFNIYKKEKLPNFVYITRDGEQPLHAGPEGRREDELLAYERKWIDNFTRPLGK